MKKLNGTLFNITGSLKSLLRTQLPGAGIRLAQHSGFNQNNLKNLTGKSLISALILFGASDVAAQVLTGVTSQKQAIDLLKSQGKLLPNVPTDYFHFGGYYANTKTYYRNRYPAGHFRQRYEAKNLRDIDGKDLSIDNDIDSCNFLCKTVYQANLKKIIPIIIDSQIDTTSPASGGRTMADEYRSHVDWANSKSFNFDDLPLVTPGPSHMASVAQVPFGEPNNYSEKDYAEEQTTPGTLSSVGVWPGKGRLYARSPSGGGGTNNVGTFSYIYDEASKNPDKNYILSCSRTGGVGELKDLYDKLGNMPNVIIFTGRSNPKGGHDIGTYAAHPATVEVGYVQSPGFKVVDHQTGKLSFSSEQKDRIVTQPGGHPSLGGQTGKMHGDGFCTLGEWTVSEATALMSGMVANLRAQNPNWTKDEIIAILKRDAYKPNPGKMRAFDRATQTYYDSDVEYDANGWNERFGYGVVQPGKTMKENIFPEIKTSLTKNDGKYYLSVNNWPSTYRINGAIVEKDEQGYFIDVPKQEPGTYRIVFEGDCDYEGKTYPFPIDRLVTITNPTGSTEIAKAQTLVYPNPAGNQLFIGAGEPVKTIEFCTLSGQVVSQQPGNQQTNINLSLAGLNNGVYLLRIGYQNGKTSQHKIIKTGSP